MRADGLPGFFAGAYGIAWGGILLLWAMRGFDLAALGMADLAIMLGCMLLGPSLAGLVQTGRIEGVSGMRALLGRATRWRVGWRWYAVALGTTPALLLPILAGFAWAVDPAYRPRFEPWLFVIGLLAGTFEEIGWTGFATPRLLRCGWWCGGAMLGGLWALWHLLADLGGNVAAMGSLWPLWFAVYWLATLPAYRILMTWVYAHTGSLLVAMLMHAGYTGWLFVLTPKTTVPQGLAWQAVFAAALWIVVLLVRRQARSRATNSS